MVEQRSLAGIAGTYRQSFDNARTEYKYVYDEASSVQHSGQRNLKGRLAELHLPSGARYFYGYDAQGQQTLEHLIQGDKTFTSRYAYDDLTRLKEMRYPNGQNVTYAYSPRHGELIKTQGMFNTEVDYNDFMLLGRVAVQEKNTPQVLTQLYSYTPSPYPEVAAGIKRQPGNRRLQFWTV